MSGGVDSAVALLRAGPHAIGVTLRLWLDPEGPDAERACCSPERGDRRARDVPRARAAARDARPARGVPPRGRRRRSCAATRAARRRTRASRCNGGFRFAELLAFARRAGAARLATGHYARIVEQRGRLLLARAADAAKDQSYMLARLDPRVARRGSGSRSASRRRPRRAPRPSAPGSPPPAAPRARRRASSPATTTARSSSGTGSSREPGAIVDEDGRELGAHDGFWRFTPGQRRGLGVAAAGRCTRSRRRRHEHGRRRPARVAGHARASPRADGCTSTSSGSRRSCATARRRCGDASSRRRAASASSSTSRRTASRAGRQRCSTRATASSGRARSRRRRD